MVITCQEGKKPGGRGPFKEGCVPRGKRKATNCFRESRHWSPGNYFQTLDYAANKAILSGPKAAFYFILQDESSIHPTDKRKPSFVHSFIHNKGLLWAAWNGETGTGGNRSDRNQRHSCHAEASTERRGDGDLPGADRGLWSRAARPRIRVSHSDCTNQRRAQTEGPARWAGVSPPGLQESGFHLKSQGKNTERGRRCGAVG